MKSHLESERFAIVTSKHGLPLGVRDALQELFGSGPLDLADPGEEFQADAVTVGSALPTRRLAAAGCSSDHCLVYYERGGSTRTWRVALFHWAPGESRFEWGGAAPGGFSTIDDVRGAVVSGRITSSERVW